MLFNSIDFLVFLAVVLTLVHLAAPPAQKWILLLAGCFFYGYWNRWFLGLLFLTSSIDFICAQRIEAAATPRARKLFLALSLGGNLAILGYFKYGNFFVESLRPALEVLGLGFTSHAWHIILPVGISFYTFQAMSYIVDVYRGRLAACRNLRDFYLYISFFPQLVAGPIERAGSLLPQLTAPRRVTRVDIAEGAYLVLWGFCKKVVVADNLALKVDRIFSQGSFTTGDVVLGALGFAFQVYADFSGYTDIARGVARWLGVRLTLNFDHPYFASSPQDFWRRWHISLSTWLREYVYIPLGGNRLSAGRTNVNLMATMLLGGLWHGAAWNFVLWGGYQGMLLVATRGRTGAATSPHPSQKHGAGRWLGSAATFCLVLYGWLLFRARGMEQLVALHRGLFTGGVPAEFFRALANMLPYIGLVLAVDIVTFKTKDPFFFAKLPPLLTALFYLFLLYAIFILGVSGGGEFIYFAF
jgi:alginate O-acetyltransferase complex protein AlgI